MARYPLTLTDQVHYPNYCIKFYHFFGPFKETYEKRRETQQKELKQKEEEMRQMFVQRVKEKEQVLKESEREVRSFAFPFYTALFAHLNGVGICIMDTLARVR